MNIQNLNISTRLALGFGLLYLFNVILVVVALVHVRKVQNDVVLIYRHPITVNNAVSCINTNNSIIHFTLQQLLNDSLSEFREEDRKSISRLDSIILHDFDVLEDRFLGSKSVVDSILISYKKVRSARKAILNFMISNQFNKAITLFEDVCVKNHGNLSNETRFLSVFAKEKADEFYQNSVASEKSAYHAIISVFFLTLVASFWVGVVVTKGIANPIRLLAARIKESLVTHYALDISDAGLSDQQMLELSALKLDELSKDLKAGKDELGSILKEKEVLLKEIHHRVKNNLQVITSLLSLQSSYIGNQKMKRVFLNTQYRVNSMGLIHEMLYKSESLDTLNYQEYLEKLVASLVSSIWRGKRKISTHIEVLNFMPKMNTAIPLGLLINEITTNSLKHAFTDNYGHELYIKIHSIGKRSFELLIGDNGVGAFRNINTNNGSATLGWLLIQKLVLQLEGSVRNDKEKEGMNYKIIFKDLE